MGRLASSLKADWMRRDDSSTRRRLQAKRYAPGNSRAGRAAMAMMAMMPRGRRRRRPDMFFDNDGRRRWLSQRNLRRLLHGVNHDIVHAVLLHHDQVLRRERLRHADGLHM